MTQGFYEQLGVHPDADRDTLRDAYHRQVARLVKRTRQLHEQGVDTGPLDLTRAQLDEAWAVLSVPTRRQRYDAMLRFLETERSGVGSEALWAEVGPSLVPPSVAAAAALLGRATQLDLPKVGRPPAIQAPARPMPTSGDPGTTPTLAPATAVDATDATEATHPGRPAAHPGITAPRPKPVIALPRPAPVASITPVAHLQAVPTDPRPTHPTEVRPADARADFKVVEGTPRASSVIVLPADAPRQKTLTPDEVARLVDIHGYSGGLLRAVREAKGVALSEVAQTTRISVRYLEAIEGDAHDRLPSSTFVKGYVREIARLLKLDEEAVVRGYMLRVQG